MAGMHVTQPVHTAVIGNLTTWPGCISWTLNLRHLSLALTGTIIQDRHFCSQQQKKKDKWQSGPQSWEMILLIDPGPAPSGSSVKLYCVFSIGNCCILIFYSPNLHLTSCHNVPTIIFSVPNTTHICQIINFHTQNTLAEVNPHGNIASWPNIILNILVGAHNSRFTGRSCLLAHTERGS
jgi:hypothetical protein